MELLPFFLLPLSEVWHEVDRCTDSRLPGASSLQDVPSWEQGMQGDQGGWFSQSWQRHGKTPHTCWAMGAGEQV